jgi:hypothetical protein
LDTKDELSVEINKLLGTQLASLSRMTFDDLKILRDILSKGPEQGQFLGAVFRRPLKDVLNEKILDKSLGELSLMELLGMEDKGGGILGLGLLPRLRTLVSGEKKET